ncbi:UNVERIFIED_ORG: hypothetical protein M2414_004746 [Rahnella aquatilis]
MGTTEYQFDTKEEITDFIEELFKNPKERSVESIIYRSEQMKFASAELKEFFVKQGKEIFAKANW